jgi:WhiB family redox-sensing transcriptional regulator
MLLERPSLLACDPLPRSTELYPTSWLRHPAVEDGDMVPPLHWVRIKQWHGAAELDRMHELPPVPVDTTIRRAIPKDWKSEAACHGEDLATFFGDEGGERPALRRSVLRKAKQICDSCPVVRACLIEALEKDERGVWGGTSRRQRKVFRHQISHGETTIEEVVDECHPSAP